MYPHLSKSLTSRTIENQNDQLHYIINYKPEFINKQSFVLIQIVKYICNNIKSGIKRLKMQLQKTSQKPKLVLGYWAIRGRAQVVRLILNYLGLEFQNVIYRNNQAWFGNARPTIGLDFINLPFLLDNGFKLTETNAIIKYLINTYGQHEIQLLGRTNQQIATTQSMVGLLDDLSTPIMNLCYSQSFQAEKQEVFRDKLQWRIDQFVKYLGHKQWLMGYLTWADFKFSEFLLYIKGIWPAEYSLLEYEQIFEPYLLRFSKLPGVSSYYQKSDATRWPFLPNFAHWHGQNMQYANGSGGGGGNGKV